MISVVCPRLCVQRELVYVRPKGETLSRTQIGGEQLHSNACDRTTRAASLRKFWASPVCIKENEMTANRNAEASEEFLSRATPYGPLDERDSIAGLELEAQGNNELATLFEGNAQVLLKAGRKEEATILLGHAEKLWKAAIEQTEAAAATEEAHGNWGQTECFHLP